MGPSTPLATEGEGIRQASEVSRIKGKLPPVVPPPAPPPAPPAQSHVAHGPYKLGTAAQLGHSPYSSSLNPVTATASYSDKFSPYGRAAASRNDSGGSKIAALPADVQFSLGNRNQRFIQTGTDENNAETLDPRKIPLASYRCNSNSTGYRRVSPRSHAQFFVPGRVSQFLLEIQRCHFAL